MYNLLIYVAFKTTAASQTASGLKWAWHTAIYRGSSTCVITHLLCNANPYNLLLRSFYGAIQRNCK